MGAAEEGRRLAIVINGAEAMVNFRSSLIAAAVAQGYTVHAFAPDYTAASRERIRALGAEPVDFRLDRTGRNPVADLATTLDLARRFRALGIDTVLSCFIKPAIYGSLAASLARVPHRLAMIEGLGTSFTTAPGMPARRGLLSAVVMRLLRAGLSRCRTVFVLNQDDARFLAENRMATADQIVRLRGIGVDLSRLAPADEPVTKPVFVLIGRMLREKGVCEFVEAAGLLKPLHPEARFVLAGGLDSNPSAISRATLDRWVSEGAVEWLGHVSDIPHLLRRAQVFVLPSYREGMPRSTQEAMAMGLPVVSTDAPGARETVVEGENGFLVPVGDSRALADAMARFIADPSLAGRMGRESRRLAEEWFDEGRINSEILGHLEG